MEFFDWSFLGTYAGAMVATAALTQLTKELPYIKALPTQLWSYILSFVTLLLAEVFSGAFSVSGAVLALFNAVLVSLASNGGYEAIRRMMQEGKTTNQSTNQ